MHSPGIADYASAAQARRELAAATAEHQAIIERAASMVALANQRLAAARAAVRDAELLTGAAA